MKRTIRTTDIHPDNDREVGDEIRFHLEMRMREFIDQGMTAEEARRAAQASFGDVNRIASELGVARVRAKVDSGARSSALHVDEQWRFTEAGAPWVGFRLTPGKSTGVIEAHAPIFDERDRELTKLRVMRAS